MVRQALPPRRNAGTAVRVLVPAGITVLLAGSAIIAMLQVVGPGAAISPMRQTISEYGLTSVAWVFDVAVLAVAAGSAAILAAVVLITTAAGTASRAATVLGALWVAGLVTLVAFPKTNWALGPSVSGQVHRAASLVAFIALPLAVTVTLRRRMSRGLPAFAVARWALALAIVALAWFTPIVVAIVSTGRGGAWWLAVPLGLVERGMAVTEIAALVLLGVWAARTARCPAGASPRGVTAARRGAQVRVLTGNPVEPAPGAALPVTDPTAP